MLEDHRRQRAVSRDLKISRAAMSVVVPINRSIGPWQTRARWLLAMAEKFRTTGQHDPKLLAEAEDLTVQVERQLQALSERSAGLPDSVTTHSRFQDTLRALDSLKGVLAEVRTSLGTRDKRN